MTPTEQADLMTAVADVIQDHIALALRDLTTQLAVAQSQIAGFAEREKAWTDVRDRLIVMEAKASIPVPLVEYRPEIDRHALVLERIASVEAKCVAVEAKAVPVAPVDLTDRVAAVEVGLSSALLKLDLKSTETGPLMTSLAELAKDFGYIRERVAVVEVRGQVPGPSGKDGAPGKDGVDGIGFDDLAAVQTDDRTITFRATKGDRVKDFGTMTIPFEEYKGVYISGLVYDRGHRVTWDGSDWYCNETTSARPGDGSKDSSKAWTLRVKRGSNGKDGKDGKDAVSLPVVTIGGRG